MNTYLLYIKSHCEYPDYEDDVEARNKKEAVEYFYSKLARWDWQKDEIEKYVARWYKNGSIR